jgi:hypothetical protein
MATTVLLSNCESGLRRLEISSSTQSPEGGPIGGTVNLDSYHRPITASRDEPETKLGKYTLGKQASFSPKRFLFGVL